MGSSLAVEWIVRYRHVSWEVVDVAPDVICVAKQWCRVWKKQRAQPLKAMASKLKDAELLWLE